MAIVVPIVSEWNPKGVNKATADIEKAQGGWAKASAGIKSAALPAAAALGAIGVAGFGAFKAAEEAAVANKKLEQVYASIGYPQLAKDAQAYADSLSKQIGVEDEVIKSAQTKLATFSEVAKSADIMGQATGLAADLTAAGFGSMDSTATMLGKALQDPIKGMTALGKAGVTFTKDQKEQIKALVESGKAAEAQGIILGEVEKQVGGVAKASATTTDKMRVGWGELQEQFGAALLPVIDSLLPKFEAFTNWISQNEGLFKGLVVAVGGLAAGILALNGAIAAYNTIAAVVKLATVAWTAVQTALNTALAANPVGLIVLAIAALIGGLILAYKKSETFRKIVDGALRLVGKAFTWLWEKAGEALRWIKEKGWDVLVFAIKNSPLGLTIRALFAAFRWLKEKIADWVKWVKDKWDSVVAFFDKFDLGRIWESLRDGFISAINFIIRAWNRLDFEVPKLDLGPFGSFGGFTVGLPDIPEIQTAARRSSTTNNYYISGAVDPNGTARQITRLQTDRARNTGRLVPAVVL